MNNIFDIDELKNFDKEIFQDLFKNDKVRIERIVSHGQTTPENEWYDQNEDEWVILLQGEAKILFEDGENVSLSKGDYLQISAKRRHKVTFTSQNPPCIWLAIFS